MRVILLGCTQRVEIQASCWRSQLLGSQVVLFLSKLL